MWVSRRRFIETFGAAALACVTGVSVEQPSFLDVVNEGINPEWDGSIRLEDLEAAYQACMAGSSEPDLILASRETLELHWPDVDWDEFLESEHVG